MVLMPVEIRLLEYGMARDVNFMINALWTVLCKIQKVKERVHKLQLSRITCLTFQSRLHLIKIIFNDFSDLELSVLFNLSYLEAAFFCCKMWLRCCSINWVLKI